MPVLLPHSEENQQSAPENSPLLAADVLQLGDYLVGGEHSTMGGHPDIRY